MKTGVSCKIYIPGDLKDTFLFKVKKDGEILTGSVLNKSTGRVDVIGQWKIANSEGFLAASQVSWIENYLMNKPNYTLVCDKKGWPYYEVKFLPPIGNDKIQGNISGLNQGSKTCLGAIKWKNDKTGTLIIGGYK